MGLVHGVISVHPLPDLVFLPSGFQLCNCRKEKSNRLLQVITSSSCSKPWSSLDVCLAVPLIILRNKQPRDLRDIQQQPFVGLCVCGGPARQLCWDASHMEDLAGCCWLGGEVTQLSCSLGPSSSRPARTCAHAMLKEHKGDYILCKRLLMSHSQVQTQGVGR